MVRKFPGEGLKVEPRGLDASLVVVWRRSAVIVVILTVESSSFSCVDGGFRVQQHLREGGCFHHLNHPSPYSCFRPSTVSGPQFPIDVKTEDSAGNDPRQSVESLSEEGITMVDSALKPTTGHHKRRTRPCYIADSYRSGPCFDFFDF
jgi:hypothetical protein